MMPTGAKEYATQYGIQTSAIEMVVPLGEVILRAEPLSTAAYASTLYRGDVAMIDQTIVVKPSGTPTYPYVELRWKRVVGYFNTANGQDTLKEYKSKRWMLTSIQLHTSPTDKTVDALAIAFKGAGELILSADELRAMAFEYDGEVAEKKQEFYAAMRDLTGQKKEQIATVVDAVKAASTGSGGSGGGSGALLAGLGVGALLLLLRR